MIPKPSKLEGAIINLINDPDLKNAQIGIYIIDLDNNKIISKKNETTGLIPASTQKIITTSAGLGILGADFKFKTQIQYTGTIDSLGNLNGDIIIKGGGDPALGSERFKNYFNPDFIDVWCDSVIAAGIKKINGNIISDKSMYSRRNPIPATWVWGDIANYYGAGVFALSVYENMYKIHFESGKNQGDSTIIKYIEPEIPGLIIENHVTASNVNSDNAYIYGGVFDNYRIIEGTIPKNKTDFIVKGSIPNPPLLIANKFNKALIEKGVDIAGTATTTDRISIPDSIIRHNITCTYSPPLSSLIYVINMVSHNLFADHLLVYLGYLKFGSGDFISGTKAVEEYWKSKGIDIDGMNLQDGSGLSHFNTVTPKQLVDILSFVYKSNYKDIFMKTLPVAGVSGTMMYSCKGTVAENMVFAKSGSMTRVRSCAGYVKTITGKNLAFSIIVNNYNCSSYQMKLKIDKIFEAMAEYPN
ncbi:MAG: D-alanyl-D-alanine carboxypeptidase/D-alanyl-D-alanine-endopeptidase [Marinilabiliales bacterium]